MSEEGGPGAPNADATPSTGASSADEGQRALDALALGDDERLVLAKVADILRRINYGTVVLVVQDGKVVQIEMAEKFRLR
ncbi:MAG TPA: YezD family protein [Actinomycetota bacterium]|nr:YezD family protein [Actinomycetota bacterium]